MAIERTHLLFPSPSDSSDESTEVIEQRGFIYRRGAAYQVEVIRLPIDTCDRASFLTCACILSLCLIPLCSGTIRKVCCKEPYQGYADRERQVYDLTETNRVADADYAELPFDGRDRDSVIAYLREPGVADTLQEANGHHYMVIEHPTSGFCGFIFVPDQEIDRADYILMWSEWNGSITPSPEEQAASAIRYCESLSDAREGLALGENTLTRDYYEIQTEEEGKHIGRMVATTRTAMYAKNYLRTLASDYTTINWQNIEHRL